MNNTGLVQDVISNPVVAGGLCLVVSGVVCVLFFRPRLLRLRQQLNVARNHIGEAGRRIRSLQDQLDQAQGELHNARSAMGAGIKDAKEIRAQLEQGLTQKNEHITGLNDQVQQLKQVEAQARERREALERQIIERDGRIATLREREKDYVGELERFAEDYSQLQDLYNRADWRVLRVAEAQGRIWEGEVVGHAPPFRRPDENAACIISVMNLKGGVGKSTIAANLGATLWKQGRSVLLVDLDFQGSLTSLCLPPNQVNYLRQDGRFVQNLFADDRPNLGKLRASMEAVNHTSDSFKILATDDGLADYEECLMARWLIGKTEADIRFHLRSILQDRTVQRDFDYIIIDCPPRRTTSSINALAASDFLLIPTVLDETSTEAAPRFLATLGRLKQQKQLCGNLKVLGVVANMVQEKNALTSVEADRMNRLRVQCGDRWSEPIYSFKTAIPHRKAFGNAAEQSQFAVFYNDRDIGDVFRRFAAELESQIGRQPLYAANDLELELI